METVRTNGQKVAVDESYECTRCGHNLPKWAYESLGGMCSACWQRHLQEELLITLTAEVVRSCDEDCLPRAIKALEFVLTPVL